MILVTAGDRDNTQRSFATGLWLHLIYKGALSFRLPRHGDTQRISLVYSHDVASACVALAARAMAAGTRDALRASHPDLVDSALNIAFKEQPTLSELYSHWAEASQPTFLPSPRACCMDMAFSACGWL